MSNKLPCDMNSTVEFQTVFGWEGKHRGISLLKGAAGQPVHLPDAQQIDGLLRRERFGEILGFK